MDLGNVNSLLLLGVSDVRDCVCLRLGQSAGGENPGYWQYDRQRESAAGAAALVPRQLTPPPDVAKNNNMTIRRIYKKTRIVVSRQTALTADVGKLQS